MKKSQLVKYFGTKAALARACKVSRQAVGQWPEIIPELQQYRLRDWYPGIDEQLRKGKK